jgi:hypothetical protein
MILRDLYIHLWLIFAIFVEKMKIHYENWFRRIKNILRTMPYD